MGLFERQSYSDRNRQLMIGSSSRIVILCRWCLIVLFLVVLFPVLCVMLSLGLCVPWLSRLRFLVLDG